jgi:hypothetical protein
LQIGFGVKDVGHAFFDMYYAARPRGSGDPD